jgi:hypothetical protein
MRRDLWWLLLIVLAAVLWPRLRLTAPVAPKPAFHSLTVCHIAPGYTHNDVRAVLDPWSDARVRWELQRVITVSGSSVEIDDKKLSGPGELYEQLGQPQIRANGAAHFQHLTWTRLANCLFEADVPEPGYNGTCFYRLSASH